MLLHELAVSLWKASLAVACFRTRCEGLKVKTSNDSNVKVREVPRNQQMHGDFATYYAQRQSAGL